jgi:uncharacterized membrane protein YedE/YeeE
MNASADSPFWPFWAGALALASVAVLHAVLVGRPLGVSGQIGRALDKLASTSSRTSALVFLGALAVGGFIGGMSDGAVDAQLATTSTVALQFFGEAGVWLALFGGGALVGFGTSLAGGCTSGHGLVGCARLQPASLIVTAAFFGTAVAVTFALRAVTSSGGAQ